MSAFYQLPRFSTRSFLVLLPGLPMVCDILPLLIILPFPYSFIPVSFSPPPFFLQVFPQLLVYSLYCGSQFVYVYIISAQIFTTGAGVCFGYLTSSSIDSYSFLSYCIYFLIPFLYCFCDYTHLVIYISPLYFNRLSVVVLND